MNPRSLLQRLLVLALVVLSLQLVSNPNHVSANSTHVASEANSPSIPNYQWQFLSPSEKAAVDASVKVIMNERFKNITVNIVEASGTPYTGKLQVTQTSTSFINWAGWESNTWWPERIAMNPSRTGEVWAPWNDVEPSRGVFSFSDADGGYTNDLRHGITNFHLFIGPSLAACCVTLPEWAKTLEYDSLKSAMQKYVEAVVSHFKGRIQYYEIWWEANAYFGNGNWPLDHIIDIIKMEALTIRAIDPNARICVDLDNVSPDQLEHFTRGSNWTTEYFIQQLLAAGVPFDVIGLETHIGSGWANTAGGVDTLYHRLIDLAKFGKPIYVWEDGLASYIDPAFLSKQGLAFQAWAGIPGEDKQAEWMAAETVVYLGNPSVLGVKWYMLEDQPSDPPYQAYDGVLHTDGTPKKSYYALQQLWNSLMVNETVQSVNGVATFKGLAGNYSISAKGYEVNPAAVHVSEGNQNTFSFVVRSTARTITSITSIASITPTTSSEYYTAQTFPGLVLPMSYMEYLGAIVLLGAIAIGAILISGKRARIPAAAKKRPSRGVQFCINCGVELPLDSKSCGKCGAAQT
jgi:hypothetical protein